MLKNDYLCGQKTAMNIGKTASDSWLNMEHIRKSEGGVEYHPLKPFLPENARVLFLGSFPPQRKRWCMDFYYPNFINDHWRIEGEVFFGNRRHFVLPEAKRFHLEAIVAFCRERGIAFFDTATAVRRLKDNAADEFLEVVEPTDIRVLLQQLPHVEAIVTTGQKATDTICAYFGMAAGPKVGASVSIPGVCNADGRPVCLYRLPSSSRAYPLSFEKKAAFYREMFSSVGLLRPVPVLLRYDMGDDVVAFSTTRQGGCSEGPYSSFNINRYCGDSDDHILRNREALCRLLGISDDRLFMPHQTHGTEMALIDEAFLSLTAAEQQATLEGVDALMTDLKEVCIGVSTADCIPILLCDPEHHAVCAVHAGWRGTVGRIVEKSVAAMVQTYHSRPSVLVAQIGPGISLDSFEVGQEVYDAFAAAGFDMAAIARRYPSASSLQEWKWHVDLPKCNRQQLIEAGLLPASIIDSATCTYQQHDAFFSARRLGIRSGRIFTGIYNK